MNRLHLVGSLVWRFGGVCVPARDTLLPTRNVVIIVRLADTFLPPAPLHERMAAGLARADGVAQAKGEAAGDSPAAFAGRKGAFFF